MGKLLQSLLAGGGSSKGTRLIDVLKSNPNAVQSEYDQRARQAEIDRKNEIIRKSQEEAQRYIEEAQRYQDIADIPSKIGGFARDVAGTVAAPIVEAATTLPRMIVGKKPIESVSVFGKEYKTPGALGAEAGTLAREGKYKEAAGTFGEGVLSAASLLPGFRVAGTAAKQLVKPSVFRGVTETAKRYITDKNVLASGAIMGGYGASGAAQEGKTGGEIATAGATGTAAGLALPGLATGTANILGKSFAKLFEKIGTRPKTIPNPVEIKATVGEIANITKKEVTPEEEQAVSDLFSAGATKDEIVNAVGVEKYKADLEAPKVTAPIVDDVEKQVGRPLTISEQKIVVDGAKSGKTTEDIVSEITAPEVSKKETGNLELLTDSEIKSLNKQDRSDYEKFIKEKADKLPIPKEGERVVIFTGDGKEGQYVDTDVLKALNRGVTPETRVEIVKESDLSKTGFSDRDALGIRKLSNDISDKEVETSTSKLYEEARKYSTPEDFKNSQKIYFRGSNNKTDDSFVGGKIFLSGNKDFAKKYGKNISEYSIDNSAIIIDGNTGDGYKLIKQYTSDKNAPYSLTEGTVDRGIQLRWTEEKDFTEWLGKKGIKYDGIVFAENDRSSSLAMMNKDKLISKSKLYDIWKEAHSKTKKGNAEIKKQTKKPLDKEKQKKTSIIAERLNKDLPEDFKIDEQYDPKVIKEEVDRAAKLISEDKAKAIKKAVDPNTNPMERDAILIELSEIAKRDGDYSTLSDLFSRRSELIRSGAQSLNMEKASILLNPQEKYMRDIVNARLSKVKIDGKELTSAELSAKRKSISKETSDVVKKAFKVEDAQQLFDSLICK